MPCRGRCSSTARLGPRRRGPFADHRRSPPPTPRQFQSSTSLDHRRRRVPRPRLLSASVHAGHRVRRFSTGEGRTDWPGGVEVVSRRPQCPTHHLGRTSLGSRSSTPAAMPRDVLAPRGIGQACGDYLFVSSVWLRLVRQAPVRESDTLAQLGTMPGGHIWTRRKLGALKAARARRQSPKHSVSRDAGPARSHVRYGAAAARGVSRSGPRRFAQGGAVLAPGPPQRAVASVDCHGPSRPDGRLARTDRARTLTPPAGGRLHVGQVADGVRDRGRAARRPGVRDHLVDETG